MTQPIAWLDGPHWPYLALFLFAVLPTEIWRWLAVAFARGLDADSVLLDWVRAVATALAGIVAKLIVSPPGALAHAPLLVRIASLAAAVAVMALSRRRMMLAVLLAEAVLIGGTWLFAPA